MMTTIKRGEWVLLVVLAIAGAALWCRFALPRYQAIDLSVDQAQALSLAKDFLALRHLNIQGYQSVVVFDVDDSVDRYLQKTLGTEASRKWLQQWDYDLFFWVARFFKEHQKEEIKVVVSSRNGQVIAFIHDIEETALRKTIPKETARNQAIEFLRASFGFDPASHILHNEEVKKHDHRLDYSFTWEVGGVEIPWDQGRGGGSAKLLTTMVVSGEDTLVFQKRRLEIPEGFNRHIESLKQTGQNLTLLFRLLYLSLLTLAIMLVVNRKQFLVPKIVKPFYVGVGTALFLAMTVEVFNEYRLYVFSYPTAQSFTDYFMREIIEHFLAPFFLVLAFVLPGLAGESLRFEVAPQHQQRGFLSAMLSSFFNRFLTGKIIVGYAIAIFILGAQAFIFHLGYTYCGVWDELSWLSQSSTAVVPAFTALLIGLQASFSEEIMFRLFAINFFKKYGLSTLAAVVISALIWGFGHTGYAIFPMWFRGIEVTCLGLILGVVYLRFGLVTVIVAHFLMDAFLVSLPYFLKPKFSFDFYSSLLVVSLPLLFALAAWFLKRPTVEREISVRFSPQQEFNCHLLQAICLSKTPPELAEFKRELLRHGWDPIIVDRVIKI